MRSLHERLGIRSPARAAGLHREGTEIDWVPLDPGDWLDDDDREALHRALDASEADVAAGRLVDADDVLKEICFA